MSIKADHATIHGSNFKNIRLGYSNSHEFISGEMDELEFMKLVGNSVPIIKVQKHTNNSYFELKDSNFEQIEPYLSDEFTN